MKQSLTIYSSKGGVGKTTLAHNIAAILSSSGEKVLLIDTDPQNSISGMIGIENPNGLSEIFELPLEKLIYTTEQGIYVLPTGTGAIENTNDYMMLIMNHREEIKKALLPLWDYFDYIIFDTPPGFSPMADLAMQLSDTIIAVLEADATSYATMELMQKALSKIKKHNENKKIYFVTNKVFTDEISINFETIYRYLFDTMYLFALPFDSNVKYAAAQMQTLEDYNHLSPLYQSLLQMLEKLLPDFNADLLRYKSKTP